MRTRGAGERGNCLRTEPRLVLQTSLYDRYPAVGESAAGSECLGRNQHETIWAAAPGDRLTIFAQERRLVAVIDRRKIAK